MRLDSNIPLAAQFPCKKVLGGGWGGAVGLCGRHLAICLHLNNISFFRLPPNWLEAFVLSSLQLPFCNFKTAYSSLKFRAGECFFGFHFNAFAKYLMKSVGQVSKPVMRHSGTKLPC